MSIHFQRSPLPLFGIALLLALTIAGCGGGGGADYGLMRFDATGQPDATFNNGAALSVDLFGGFDTPGAMLLQLDGRLVIAGRAYNGSSVGMGLVRLVP